MGGIETRVEDQSSITAGELPQNLGTPDSVANHVEYGDGNADTNLKDEHQPPEA